MGAGGGPGTRGPSPATRLGGGRFEEVHFLGEGACGQVFRARDRQLGRLVAVKVLSHTVRSQEGVLARFRREARVQAQLDHPNIVGIFDADLEGENPFLVMEYVQGEELRAHLEQSGPLGPARVLRLAGELASALDRLHEAGIIHRDLKPANVMLRQDGSAVLMDLGMAFVRDETGLTRTGQVLGTPLYLAPETLMGSPWSPASDQYQLGLVLGEALVGTRLIPGGTLGEVSAAILSGDRIPWPETVAREYHLVRALDQALSVDPEERFPSCVELVSAMAGEEERGSPAAPERVGASPPSSLPGEASPSPRGAGGSVLGRPGLVLLLLLACFLGGVLLPGLREGRAPEEVRFQVIGDCLVVDFLPAGARDVFLRVGTPGESFPVEEIQLGDGRRRLLARGLEAQGETPAQLVWSGGSGPRSGYRAERSPLRSRIGLAPGRKLRVGLRRPLELGFGILEPREPGEYDLSPPEAAPWVLRWRERGIEFRREIDPTALFEAAARRWLERMQVLDPDEAQRLRAPAYLIDKETVGEDATAPLRAELEPVRSWARELLTRPRDGDLRRRFWKQWQLWERSALQARALGHREARLLSLPTEGAGGRSWSKPRNPPGEWGAIPFETVGGEGQKGSEVTLIDGMARFFDNVKYRHGADAIRFRWPTLEGAGDGVALSLALRSVDRYEQLHLLEQEAGGEPLAIWLWTPEPTAQGGKSLDRWFTLRLPRSLEPEAGAVFEIRLRSFLFDRPLVVELLEIRVAPIHLDPGPASPE